MPLSWMWNEQTPAGRRMAIGGGRRPRSRLDDVKNRHTNGSGPWKTMVRARMTGWTSQEDRLFELTVTIPQTRASPDGGGTLRRIGTIHRARSSGNHKMHRGARHPGTLPTKSRSEVQDVRPVPRVPVDQEPMWYGLTEPVAWKNGAPNVRGKQCCSSERGVGSLHPTWPL